MTPVINGVMLAVSSSLAASIVAKATVATALGLIGAWLTRRSCAAVRMRYWLRRLAYCSRCQSPPSSRRRSASRCGS
jgi:hypothetical protein